MPTTANFDVAALEPFTAAQGADLPLSWTFTDASGAALDLTGYVFRVLVRDLLGFTWVDQSVTISSGNTVAILVPAAKMVMPAGTALYELLATPASSTPRPWGRGAMYVQKSQA